MVNYKASKIKWTGIFKYYINNEKLELCLKNIKSLHMNYNIEYWNGYRSYEQQYIHKLVITYKF